MIERKYKIRWVGVCESVMIKYNGILVDYPTVKINNNEYFYDDDKVK